MTGSISILTPNPNDVTLEEADELAVSIRNQFLDAEVRVDAREREGYGVTFYEIIRISIEVGTTLGVGKAAKVVAEEAAKKITGICVDWVRERFKGRRKGSRRPVLVHIYGPDGTIQSTVIKNATDEPEDRTEQDRLREQQAAERKKTE